MEQKDVVYVCVCCFRLVCVGMVACVGWFSCFWRRRLFVYGSRAFSVTIYFGYSLFGICGVVTCAVGVPIDGASFADSTLTPADAHTITPWAAA